MFSLKIFERREDIVDAKIHELSLRFQPGGSY
jgi:hypothetical protein